MTKRKPAAPAKPRQAWTPCTWDGWAPAWANGDNVVCRVFLTKKAAEDYAKAYAFQPSPCAVPVRITELARPRGGKRKGGG